MSSENGGNQMQMGKKHFHFICWRGRHIAGFALGLLCCAFSSPALAGNNADELFQTGEEFYNEGRYEDAIQAFSNAIEIAPQTAVYHHRLGKSYGRLAEQSSLLKAYNLSGKTRNALEQAVALDNSNIEALSDLLKYYEHAPVFLGGGKAKADTVRERLLELEHSANDI